MKIPRGRKKAKDQKGHTNNLYIKFNACPCCPEVMVLAGGGVLQPSENEPKTPV
jgi:hypothetical protein